MSHKRARHSIGTCINSDDCARQCRLSARQLTKQPHVKRIRDREPSRLPLKRIVLALRKRKNRSFLKQYFLNSAPKSSFLNMVANNYKLCCFQFVHMQHIFIESFAYFKPSVNFSSKSQLKSGHHRHKYTNQQYHISQKKLMLSGDIELNPGPSYNVLLEQRLRHFQLRPFDVGGDGDCFFRAVSHQLYGDPEHHLQVRAAGIAYMRDNPERFIESSTEMSWLEYLNNMSIQGTWGDAIIIQAVADQLKLKIVIAETNEHFTEYSIVQAVSSTQQLTEVYLGHIDEYHYVSTLPRLPKSDNLNQNHLNFSENVDRNQTTKMGFNQNISNSKENVNITGKQATLSCQFKQQKKQYMNEYMRQKRAGQIIQAQINSLVSKQKNKQYMKEYRQQKRASKSFQAPIKSPEFKQKRKQYMKEYRQQKQVSESFQAGIQSPEFKQKRKQYMKEYRQQKQIRASFQTPIQSPEFKQKRKQYMKEYRQEKQVSESFQTPIQSPEFKQKRKQYMKEYRQQKQVSESFQTPIQSPEFKQKRKQYMKEYRKQKHFHGEPLQNLIAKFHDVASQGPLYICTCCDQLWYKHSVIPATALKKNNPSVQKKLLNKTSVNNIEWLCKTCNKHLKNNKVPPCAAINGMKFPVKPLFFDLNELECRLLAPRIAFQKLMQAPRGKQLKINGNIVNVPADVANTVSMLPRLPSETSTIKVNLKRRLQYKSSALSLNVRPHKVAECAKWLVNNGDLYKEEGISFNDSWLEGCSNISLVDDSDERSERLENVESNAANKDSSTDCQTQQTSSDNTDNEDDWSEEDEVEIPAGVTDTMLTAPDFVTDNERQYILNVAPGEGSRPISIFRDKYSEELAYPGIFLGQKRPDNTNRLSSVHYSDICKSELRRSDRRAAMCVENIFFKTKKLQMKILLGQSQVALRKCQGNRRTITAGQLKQPGAIDNMIHHNEGFKFLRALRGSPPYFEKAKKDIFAMIRQLGSATLFCSFSSAETQWIHLLRILGKLVDSKEYTDNELENLNWEEKSRLIQSDPVTCARHFDYQINQFIQNFLLSTEAPLGKIADWFYRVEYQQRGSPHIHMLIWLENAPTFGEDFDGDVVSFIDKIITCEKPNDNPELLALVNRQVHRHSHTCRKKSKSVCRFNYPQPPMRSTKILYPLDEDDDTDELEHRKETWKIVQKYLNDMKEGEDLTFDQLLVNLKLTEQNYLLAIRSSLKAPTIFLKRKPNELRINNYNAVCLSAWRANMDIQFVLDVYACAVYIVSYISKAQKGMSDLLRTACEEARRGNSTIKQQVRDIGNKFLNNVEISAQEAVYIALQLPMRKSSRQVVFISTSPPEERVKLLKPLQEIKDLEDESDEIYASGLINRYTKRPANLENLSLADWAAWYDSHNKSYIKPCRELDIDNYPLEINVDDNDDDNVENEIEPQNKKRSKARIIRSVCFNKNVDSEKHYQELIMLFTSWRDEMSDLLKNYSSYQEHYLQVKNIIDEQMKLYAMCTDDLNEIQNQLNNMDDTDDNYDRIAPGTQSIELQDELEGTQDLHPDFNENYDLSGDLGIPSTASNTDQLILHEEQDDVYRAMVQKLNREQKEFFYHVLHLIKTSENPFYCFLSGGAGVGKSHLTKCLYQAALKYYNTKAGDDFHQVKILMLAPTGKAAYNIKGNTVHSALAIPACQSLKNYKHLDSSRLNTIRCELGGLKLIFLDEISMVGSAMFNAQINNRLKDIKGSKQDFGGVSIVAIGDLFQLEPVMDRYIFKNPENSEYAVLAPNKWQDNFNMFELKEIMRQKESKIFAEILNRLREGKHTNEDIMKLKERLIVENSIHDPMDLPHLFIQNQKVNEFNERVHNAATGEKFSIKAVDSVIGANSAQLRDKILSQIPDDPRKTKQIATNLHLCVGERTEIASNVRTDDGMTNGAGNIIKRIKLNHKDKPSGIIWVQFDHPDVGEKTRHENRNLYVHGIDSTWTPIKPITTQFGVGRNQTAQVVRKQFPLRPAAAKTIHRSQGDTEQKIVVNFKTKRAIPHIHYVGLSRVTTIEGLYITDLCEEKIAVNPHVVKEMELLRNERKLELSVTPIYKTNQVSFKLCYLNARSLHKHIDDVRHDLNFTNTDINIFSETRFSSTDNDIMYNIDGYTLFRNDRLSLTSRPFGGMAVFSRVEFLPGYPCCRNVNGIEITIMKVMILPHVTIVGIYRSPKIQLQCLLEALSRLLISLRSQFNIFVGDFNINWFDEMNRRPLYNFFINDNNYRQLVSNVTTDNQTLIDHIYTNLPESQASSHILETYFSDHKAVCALVNCFE